MSRKPCVRQLQVWSTGRCFPEAEKCGKSQVLNNLVPAIPRVASQRGSQIHLTQQPYRDKSDAFSPLFPQNTENILTKRVEPRHFCS